MPETRKQYVTGAGANDRAAAARISAAVDAAWRAGGLIETDTARLIAAAVHRGLGSELAGFASTGRLPAGKQYQVMRLELDLATRGEPNLRRWAEALKQYLTCRHAEARVPAVRRRIAARSVSSTVPGEES